MTNCLGLILAGGKSTRMGRDKATLNRQGQTMLAYSQQLLTQLHLPVVVSGGKEGIADTLPNSGPLAGIYTVLQSPNRPLPNALLVVPVDMPLLTAKTLAQLIAAGSASGNATCYRDYYLPLYLPVNKTLLDYLDQVFASNTGLSKSVKSLIATVGGDQIPCESVSELCNANTPDEWQQALQQLPNR